MILTDRYSHALRRQASRETRGWIRHARNRDIWQIEISVAGRLRQDAYLFCGWHPISETPGILPGATNMTMRLDIPRD